MLDMYEKINDVSFKAKFADLVSIIGMVASADDESDALKYCLLGTKHNLVQWGHEYLRCLTG